MLTPSDPHSAAASGEPGRSADSFRAILDGLPRGVMVFDGNRRLLYANASALHSLRSGEEAFNGYPEHARSQVRFLDPRTAILIPDDQDPVSRAMRGERIVRQEFLFRRADEIGDAWLECSATPLRDSAEQVTGVVFSFENISERKMQAVFMEQHGALQDFLYRENLAGLLHLTKDGRILDCNEAIIRMLGYSKRDEVLGLRIQDLYFNPAEHGRLMQLLAASTRLSEFEVCYRRRDGSPCWMLTSMRMLDNTPGIDIATVVATVIDITERKTWAETLRKSEERFAAFMRYLPGVAFIKNVAGEYVYYSDAALPRTGMRQDDVVGRTDAELWPGEEGDHYRETDLIVIRTRRPLEMVEPEKHPDGDRFWRVYKFPIIENGEVALVGGVAIDITETRILEEQLARTGKLEALGRLAGGVAHDFNNLLTVISGYAELASAVLAKEPRERIGAYIAEILHATRRATALTSQLLAFTRGQPAEYRIFDLHALTVEMRGMIQKMIGEDIDLTVQCGSGECIVRADPHQIEQVLMNLAVNARDAMPGGGKLLIRCERQAPLAGGTTRPEEDGNQGPGTIQLEVRDTGVGMDESTRAHIFDPFFTSKETGKGTGLGLSTVYGIVAQAKGKISVESRPGEGSIFRISLPEAEGPLDVVVPLGPEPAEARAETILVVEDDEGLRSLVETMLRHLGYNVIAAEGGDAALTIWHKEAARIDAVLSDVVMPGMGGGELARRLRGMDPNVKILFMSGYARDFIEGGGHFDGSWRLIRKPFTTNELGRVLREVLNG